MQYGAVDREYNHTESKLNADTNTLTHLFYYFSHSLSPHNSDNDDDDGNNKQKKLIFTRLFRKIDPILQIQITLILSPSRTRTRSCV